MTAPGYYVVEAYIFNFVEHCVKTIRKGQSSFEWLGRALQLCVATRVALNFRKIGLERIINLSRITSNGIVRVVNVLLDFFPTAQSSRSRSSFRVLGTASLIIQMLRLVSRSVAIGARVHGHPG